MPHAAVTVPPAIVARSRELARRLGWFGPVSRGMTATDLAKLASEAARLSKDLADLHAECTAPTSEPSP